MLATCKHRILYRLLMSTRIYKNYYIEEDDDGGDNSIASKWIRCC